MRENPSRGRLVVAVVAALAAAVLMPGAAQAAPPSNDDFDNATAITLPFAEEVEMREATPAPDDPDSCYPLEVNTTWYSFAAAEDTTLRLDFGNASLDTAVFTGSRGALQLVPGTCASGWTPRSLKARAGVTYYLKVAGSTWEDRFRFTAEAVLPPANDHFANATAIDALPFTGRTTLAAATFETGEPDSGCDYNYGSPSAWYTYTPAETGAFVLDAHSPGSYNTIAAAYTGTSMTDLTEVACTSSRTVFRAEAGRTLRIQLNVPRPGAENVTLGLRQAGALQPILQISSDEPSVFDNMRFDNYSQDPEGGGTSIKELDFGDGTVVDPEPDYAYHQYAADGDYTVRMTISGSGGRTATTTRTVSIRTHDVAITGFSTPTAGRVGATKPLEVSVANTRYAETVTVTLYRGGSAGYEVVGTLTKAVPARPNGTVRFPFSYTFTAADLAEGNVVFKAVAEPAGVREALPADNTVIAPATQVRSAATRAS
ncbi:MAG: PKD domain-containing protein [Actinomycetota bacterium]|nr:PKD domain-containing protein [Actinomycetota bacterium]